MTDDNTLPADAGGTAPSLTVADAAKAIAGLLDSDDEPNTQAQGDDAEAADAKADPDADEPGEGEDAEEEAEADPEQEDQEPAQESAPVKIKLDDGSEITLDEAKKGYLRQSDYTRKSQGLAAEARQFQAEREQFSEFQRQTQLMQEQAATLIQAVMPARPDPRMLETDPFEYQKQRANWESWQEWAQTVSTNQQRLKAEEEKRFSTERDNFLREQDRRLIEARPELKDKSKRDELLNNMLSTLPDAFGFDPDEIRETTDHRLVLALEAAAKWVALQKQKPAVMAKAKDAPAVQKPGARPSPEQSKARIAAMKTQRLRQTGRVEDAARAIQDLL